MEWYNKYSDKIKLTQNEKEKIRIKHELKQVLLRAVNALAPTQKCLILLKDYEGYSYEEIGRITGLNESQVKVYLHRARLILKGKLIHLEKMSA
mgnify:CR=1 FL=1